MPCVPTVCLCVSLNVGIDLGCSVRGKWQTERGTELTTVVVDGDVFGRQLMLASHTNEQWASSPAGTRMKQVERKGRKAGEGEEIWERWEKGED